MAIDIEALRRDPDFAQLPPAVQERVITEALRENAGQSIPHGQVQRFNAPPSAGAGVHTASGPLPALREPPITGYRGEEPGPDASPEAKARFAAQPPTVQEPGAIDVPLFVPGVSEALTPLVRAPGVLPTALQVLTGNPAAALYGEAARQTLLPERLPPQGAPPGPGGIEGFLEAYGQRMRNVGAQPGPLAQAGQQIGQQAGQAVAGPVGSYVGSVLGSTAGDAAQRTLATGQLPSSREIASDAGLAAAVQAVPPLIRGGNAVLRQQVGSTQGGQALRSNLAHEDIRALTAQVFPAPPREQIDQLFAMVRASGAAIDPRALQTLWQEFTPTEQNAILRLVRHMPTGPNYPHALGERLAQQLDDLGQPAMITVPNPEYSDFGSRTLKGPPKTITIPNPRQPRPMDIGEAQQLRSFLQQTVYQAAPAPGRRVVMSDATKEALDLLYNGIDDATDTALSDPRAGVLLRNARAQWRLFRNAERLDALIDHYAPFDPKAENRLFNVAGMYRDLEDGRSALGREVARNLESAGQLQTVQETLQRLGREYKDVVQIPLTGGSAGGWMVGRHLLTQALLSDTARPALERYLRAGSGQIRLPELETLMTMLQHQTLLRNRNAPPASQTAP